MTSEFIIVRYQQEAVVQRFKLGMLFATVETRGGRERHILRDDIDSSQRWRDGLQVEKQKRWMHETTNLAIPQI